MTALIKSGPWSFLRDFQGEMSHLLDRTSLGDSVNSEMRNWSPQVDIKEESDKFVIFADLPGVDPKDVEILMENNILILKGERKSEYKENEENYSRMERSYGAFSRRFTLPKQVDADQITAKGKNGVIEILIPKSEPHMARKIEVKMAE